MARPRLCRRVDGMPKTTYFKPRAIPSRELSEACLSVEGFEAIRLADLEELTMENAASRMGVSRHTFGRILAEARKAVADALVHGRALRIAGGDYELKSSAVADG
ncbi:MAG: DUF134 domain-containing protein [Roseiarcus sp.]|uniref:DUF134 domain-containing protein n=1 Tax=Roseiarcus sp. TaxID=1969460 RepID=UPI003C1801B2